MESIYTNKFINISYNKNLNTLSGAWNKCDNADDYISGINNFKSLYLNIKPKNTLWNNQSLGSKFCEDLQKRANSFLNDQTLNQNFTGKIAMVLPENLYAKFRINNLYEELNQDMKLRYFHQEKTATDWLASSLWNKKDDALMPKLSLKDNGDDKYELSLTINKSDFQKYTCMLNHLLRSRDFCLKNSESFNSLTSREREVLQYIVKGFKNNDIANYLFLSVETIKTHRKNILSKLNCPNMYNLTKYLMFFEN